MEPIKRMRPVRQTSTIKRIMQHSRIVIEHDNDVWEFTLQGPVIYPDKKPRLKRIVWLCTVNRDQPRPVYDSLVEIIVAQALEVQAQITTN